MAPEEGFDADVTSALYVGGPGMAIGRYHFVQGIGEGPARKNIDFGVAKALSQRLTADLLPA